MGGWRLSNSDQVAKNYELEDNDGQPKSRRPTPRWHAAPARGKGADKDTLECRRECPRCAESDSRSCPLVRRISGLSTRRRARIGHRAVATRLATPVLAVVIGYSKFDRRVALVHAYGFTPCDLRVPMLLRLALRLSLSIVKYPHYIGQSPRANESQSRERVRTHPKTNTRRAAHARGRTTHSLARWCSPRALPCRPRRRRGQPPTPNHTSHLTHHLCWL